MNILLSIKPRFAEAIMNETKQYEFRRAIFKNINVRKVYVYSTSPVQKIVGAFTIGEIIEDRPNALWKRLGKYSALDREEFFGYFEGCEKGFAIGIKDVDSFSHPVDPRDLNPNFFPPQSFCYADFEELQ